MTPLYYWNSRDNFGDRFSEPLLKHYANIEVEWATPRDSKLVCVGSNLDVLPADWDGIIAGAGRLHNRLVELPNATILGVRGKLTARALNGDFCIGDPALLVDELVPRAEPEFWLGVVPHWSDTKLAYRFAHLDPLFIDPHQNPLEVVHQITRCRRIVSSSLHGVIVADAYSIPRRMEQFERMDKEGGTFKFEDYNSGIDFHCEFGIMEQVPRENVEAVQAELFVMFQKLGNLLNDTT